MQPETKKSDHTKKEGEEKKKMGAEPRVSLISAVG
jgi:hypothetical protein